MTYKLLIIDDSEIIRAVLKRVIGMINLPVENIRTGINGDEALKLIEEEKPDILFTDLNMPGLNGFELIKELHNRNILKEIRTVVISTEGNEDRQIELKNLGVDRYLRKPFTPSSVKELIESLIGVWQ